MSIGLAFPKLSKLREQLQAVHYRGCGYAHHSGAPLCPDATRRETLDCAHAIPLPGSKEVPEQLLLRSIKQLHKSNVIGNDAFNKLRSFVKRIYSQITVGDGMATLLKTASHIQNPDLREKVIATYNDTGLYQTTGPIPKDLSEGNRQTFNQAMHKAASQGLWPLQVTLLNAMDDCCDRGDTTSAQNRLKKFINKWIWHEKTIIKSSPLLPTHPAQSRSLIQSP